MNREFKHLQCPPLSKRVIGTAIAFTIPLFIGWCAGFDVLERGGELAAFLIFSFGLALNVWNLSIWTKEPCNG